VRVIDVMEINWIFNTFNWPIVEGYSFNSEHPDKSSSLSAFNWPIDEGSSSKLEHNTNQAFGVHSIGQ
jgi:hypothetical protein